MDTPQKKNEQEDLNKAPTEEKEDLQDKTNNQGVVIRPLRTYEDDVKSAIYDQNISTAKILIAEQKKKERLESDQITSEPLSDSKNRWLLRLTILLLVLGGLTLGYIYFIHPMIFKAPRVEFSIERSAIVDVDSQTEIKVEGRSREDVNTDIKLTLEAPIALDSIQEIVLTKIEEVEIDGEIKEENVPLSTENFFTYIESEIPGQVERALDENYLLGIHGQVVSEPFILFKVKDFENAFAGMLNWEPSMARDMMPIFSVNLGPKIVEEIFETATTTATTTESKNTETTDEVTEKDDVEIATTTEDTKEPVLAFDYIEGDFTDIVLNNRDARAIKNVQGEIIFFYSFIDEKHLIMTTNKAVLEEIIKRLRSLQLIL